MGLLERGLSPVPKQEAPEDLAALIITKGWESRFLKTHEEGAVPTSVTP